jgi:hypothetical protein
MDGKSSQINVGFIVYYYLTERNSMRDIYALSAGMES